MRIIAAIFLLVSTHTYAGSCMKEADQFMELVAVKFGVNSNLEKNPEQYKEEKWSYIHALGKEYFKKGKINKENAIEISKLLAKNNFSENPEVEVNIFEDYWYLSCNASKKGVESNPLSGISKEALLECWNTVSSRKEFQECLTPLVIKSKA